MSQWHDSVLTARIHFSCNFGSCSYALGIKKTVTLACGQDATLGNHLPQAPVKDAQAHGEGRQTVDCENIGIASLSMRSVTDSGLAPTQRESQYLSLGWAGLRKNGDIIHTGKCFVEEELECMQQNHPSQGCFVQCCRYNAVNTSRMVSCEPILSKIPGFSSSLLQVRM